VAIIVDILTEYNKTGADAANKSIAGIGTNSLKSAISIGAVTAELSRMVKAAADDEKSVNLLEQTIRANTDATDNQIKSVEDFIAKTQMSAAVTDDELRPALGNLIRATKDVTQAQSLMNLALDISAGTGKDLTTVSLSLSKAVNGNFGALSKLGVPLDQNAVKAKDLDGVLIGLQTSFAGMSQSAANSASGGFKKLSIAVGELEESIGYLVLHPLAQFATNISIGTNELSKFVSQTKKAEGPTGGLGAAFLNLAETIFKSTNEFKIFNFLTKDHTKTATDVTEAVDAEAARFNRLRETYIANNIAAADTVKVLDKVKTGTKSADTSTKDFSKTLEDKSKKSIEKYRDALKAARAEMADFAKSTSSELSGMVSIREAFDTNAAASDAVTTALQARQTAYEALNTAQQSNDAENLARAIQGVADAETNLTAAQQKKASMTTVGEFGKQVEMAKKFAANLSTLVGYGLGPDGLAQLLNLGPVAGSAVTDEMIGIPGVFGQFQEALGSLAGAANQLGLSSSTAFFGGGVNTAQQNLNAAKGITVNVSAGLVATPALMGQQIIDAILAAQRVSGTVFVGV
jgi:hypothetical protein